ncbi:MAG: very short patch repair endonuclease, partial [Pseudomonadota bacterium]
MNDLRSRIMRAVKSRNTQPEISVRRLVHSLGFRFRVHRKDLPGSPDLAFIAKRKVIYVHGCFWHGHTCPRGARVPKTNTEYWTNKVERNRLRDKRTAGLLKEAGWRQLIVW